MNFVWRIEMLGGLQVRGGETTLLTHFGTRKVAALLAYLALSPGRMHPREVLADLLWPEEDTEATRDRFRQALSSLRRLLEPEGTPAGRVLTADRMGVQFVSGSVVTDVSEFETALSAAENPNSERADRLERALALYAGELLPGYYEAWITPERERLEERFREALHRLAALREEQGRPEEAIELLRRATASDPLREETHSGLIRLYAATGRLSDAVRQYRTLETVLKDDLQSAPSVEIQAQFARLRAGATRRPAAPARPTLVRPEDDTPLEAEGGAVPLDSRFYLVRPTDQAFQEALHRHDSIVLVKGARQMGKTSLLARGLEQTRQLGEKVILTDLQKFTAAQLESADTLFFGLAEMIADQLDLDCDLESLWAAPRGWNVKFERFLRREVFGKVEGAFVWGLDEVDRLFGHPFCSEVFGLFRSWHNERSLNPGGPWSRLTLAIAYATEAHLFITDLNQSPFNVGTRLALADFTPDEVEELDRRYGSPLRSAADLSRFYALVGGHPYLVRRGLHALATQELALAELEAGALETDGVFGDHLHRMLSALQQDTVLCHALHGWLHGETPLDPDSFYRLRSAGLLLGRSEEEARLRCRLYDDYLRRNLR